MSDACMTIDEIRQHMSVAPTLPGTWEHDLAIALADVAAVLGVAGMATTARRPMFVAATELFARTFAPTPWLVQGLITRGGIATIGAEPKSGKTWIATEIAVAVATGTRACGEFQTERGAVAYFYAEDLDEQVRNRLRALVASRGLDPAALERLHVCPRGKFLDLTRDEDLAWVVASCRKLGKLDLLILDPLRDVHSGEEDKSDSMGPVMRRLRVLGELLGCTVMIAHHAGKAAHGKARRPGQQMRGSGAIHGSTDSGIYIGLRGGDACARFDLEVDSEVKGARSAGHFDLALAVLDDAAGCAVHATWQVSRTGKGTGDAQDAADDAAVLSAVHVELAGGRTYTATTWARDSECRAIHKIPETRAGAAIQRLRVAGRLQRSDVDLDHHKLRRPHVVPTAPAV